MRRICCSVIGVVLVAVLPPRLAAAQPAGTHVISVSGFSQVDGNPAQVEMLLVVPNGADEQAAGRRALAQVGARLLPSTPQPDASIDQIRWSQFFDSNPGNDVVQQRYNPQGAPALGDLDGLVRQAQQTWSSVPTATFRMKFAGLTTRCPSLICEFKLDGFNEMGWAYSDQQFLGLTVSDFDPATGSILESDIILNSRYTWFTGDPPGPPPPPCGTGPPPPPPPGPPPSSPDSPGGTAPPDAWDVLSVMTHEDGHLAGLGHSQGCDVMYPILDPFETTRDLSSGDIGAISSLYPLDFPPAPFVQPSPRTPEDPHGPPPPDVTVLARLGDPAPGGGTYVNDIEPYSMSDQGDGVYAADFCDGDVCGEGAFVASKGQATVMARTGDPAPGGGIFGSGVFEHIATNGAGDSSFSFWLDPPFELPIGTNAGVYRHPAGGQTVPVVVPGVTPDPFGGVFVGAEDHTSINKTDTVAFTGLYHTDQGVSGDLGAGIFTADTGGHIAPAVVPGDPAPGGGVFDFAALPSMNDLGDLAFGAHVRGEPCLSTLPQTISIHCDEGLYIKSASGQVTALVRQGDPAPGGGTFQSVRNPVINNRGDVAFLGDLTSDPFSFQLFGVYLWSHGHITLIAGPDQLMPGGGAYVTTADFPQNLGLNDADQVSFAASLLADHGGLTLPDTGVYRWTDGSMGLIARTGTEVHPGALVAGMGAYGAPDSGAAIDARGRVMFQAFVAGSKFTGNELLRVGGTVPDVTRPG